MSRRMAHSVSQKQSWRNPGAYPLGYVTNEQRRRRTLFKPTLWAVASWLIFHVAHCLRIDLDMPVVTASPARTALSAAHFERKDITIICETVHLNVLT